ncbi:MAG TPA: Asp-tRNA(Asn)/Glu-tRNA(Gln) amidotransferase GatCAB subunit A, partial [Balneolaceae bacterium]|nr:Asp-tRNA(Asn)/Glu-tRNA(Gln) amidotransferase GatCAB subunit A [Balneolaceae bacterium]
LKKEEAALKEAFEIAEGDEQIELQQQLTKLDSALIRLYKKSRTEGFGAEVKRRIMLGTYVLSAGYYDAYYGKAQKVRRLIQEDYKKAFEKVDVIVSPTAPTTAFDLGSKMDDPIQMYLNDVYTITANLAGICGISVPAGTHSNGLPYGIQFMGDSFQESKILNAARLVELQTS